MALSIKEERVDRKVRELSRLAGTSLTGAIEMAVDAELARRRSDKAARKAQFIARVREIQDRVAALPELCPGKTHDEIVGYDENGLPI